MSLAVDERAAISTEFDRTGPDVPTLCEGWNSRDLLAHLLVRERQPWAAPGIVVPALAPVTEGAMAAYGETDWTSMVDDLRKGPPPWSPYRIGKVDEFVNGAEYFVHHEDLRRGEPGWEPRPPDPERDAELWTLLGRMSRLLFRHSPVGLLLQRPDGARRVVATGEGLVTITGEPGELVLHAFGRTAARVEIEGTPEDVAAHGAAPGGL